MNEPEIIVVADQAARRDRGRRPGRRVPGRCGRRRAGAPTGRRPADRHRSRSTAGWRPGRWSTRSRGPTSTSGGATTGTCRAIIRCRTSSPSTTSCSTSATPRKGTAGGRLRGRAAAGRERPPVPDGRGDRPGSRSRLVCRGTRRRAACGRAPREGRLARLRPHASRDRRRRAHPVGLPGLGGIRRYRAGTGDPGPDAHRAARRTGHAQPGGHRRRPAGDRGRPWRRQGRDRRRHLRARAGSAALARRSWLGARVRSGSSTRRPRAACPAGDGRRRLHRGEPVRRAPRGHDPPGRESDAAGRRRRLARSLAGDVRLPTEPSRRRRPALARDRAAAEARDVGGRRARRPGRRR